MKPSFATLRDAVENDMMRRSVWIGGAVVLAAGVLGLSLWLGSPGLSSPTPGNAPAMAPGGEATSGGIASPNIPGSSADIVPYDPARRMDRESMGQTPPGTGEGGRYVFENGGNTTYLTYRRFDAKPLGVLDIAEPSADIVFSPDRIVSIRADDATIVAPENKMRSGTFRGNVIVTLHQGSDGKTVDPRTDDDVELRVYLKAAEFDVELGNLESTGDIRLVGKRVTFEGTGLSMTYNDLQSRIERLEVYRGKSLRFTPGTVGSGESSVEDKNAAPPKPDSESAKSEIRPDPFYRARFEDNVKLRGQDDALRMDGDFLDVVFALGEGRLGGGDNAADAEANPKPEAPHVNAGLPSAREPESDADPVIITWTGRLLIVPEPAPPAEIAGPDDVLMRLAGKPVSIHTPKSQTVVAAEVDYLVSSGRLRAAAGPDSAMVVHDPKVGTLRGMQLSIDQRRGTGFVTGPGQLDAATQDNEAPPDPEAPHVNAGPVPGNLTVAWTDRLDLRFFTRGDDQPADGDMVNLDRIVGLKSAEFRGNVAATEDRFDITSEQLAIHLNPPATPTPESAESGISSDKPTIDRLEAAGDVRLNATDNDANPWHIASQSLTVTLDSDEQGDLYPTRITARDDVQTTLPPTPTPGSGANDGASLDGLDLIAGMLDVTLEPKANPQAPHDPEAPHVNAGPAPTQDNSLAGNLAIRRFVAEDDVRVALHGSGVELLAGRMTSRGEDALEMFGTDADPAVIQRADDRLAGRHIVITRDGQTVDVPGAGMLDARLTARDDLTSDQADLMTVTWTDAMRYDHLAGTTAFTGGVNVATTSPDGLDRTRLSTDQLDLTLAQVPTPAPEAPHVQAGLQSTQEPFFGKRTIDTVTATGNAEFVAERDALSEREDYFDESEARVRSLAARLTIKGPTMTFDRAEQLVRVPDAGAMIVQNYGPGNARPGSTPAPDSAKSGIAPQVNFTGRGETLFTWNDSLTFDAAANDMLMLGNVRMTHRPPPPPPDVSPKETTPDSEARRRAGSDSSRVVQLDADRLLADLQDTGGLDALLAGQQPQPEIEKIQADGNVGVLYDGKVIAADHMLYDEAKRTIFFTGDDGRLVRMRDQNEPLGNLEAAGVSWNLDTDKTTISNVAGGTLPASR